MKHLTSLVAATMVWASSFAVSEAAQQALQLTGATETPAVNTKASGMATLNVDDNGVVSGGLKTSGIEGTAAHIHMGAPGASGPPVITLERAGKDQWMVPEGAKLSVDQFAAYKKGKLYVNVHSKAHPAGEIRAQLEAPTGP
jgi:CHRD domain